MSDTPKKPKKSDEIDKLKRELEELKSFLKKENPSLPDKNETMRSVKKDRMVHHDLFRLEISDTRKNVSYQEEIEHAIWEKVPHKHFFHTIDSKGKKQTYSTPSAGHFHKVDWSEIEVKDENGEVKKVLKAEIGPPLVMHKGKPTPYKNDRHTHEATYIGSEEIIVRTSNPDALRMMNFLAQAENQAKQNVTGILANER